MPDPAGRHGARAIAATTVFCVTGRSPAVIKERPYILSAIRFSTVTFQSTEHHYAKWATGG